MTAPVTITLLGEPKGKGRGRVGKLASGRPVVFTPSATRSYEASLKHAATEEMGNRPPFEGPVDLMVRAQFLVPASWSEKKRQAAIRGEIMPTKKPDGDNILKSVGDALNQVVWRDDAQIVTAYVQKRYAVQASLTIRAESPATNTTASAALRSQTEPQQR